MRGLTTEEYEMLLSCDDGMIPTGDLPYTPAQIEMSDGLIARGYMCEVEHLDGRWIITYDVTTVLGRKAMRIHEQLQVSAWPLP
jgi:hypothetical protein